MLNLQTTSDRSLATETFSLILDPNPSIESVQHVCRIFGKVLKVIKIPNALTNSVYKIYMSDRIVLLRIYGIDSDSFIDRDAELSCFIKMSELGLGPKCLATFSNGRIEEYLKAETLTSQSLRSEFLEIAESLVHLHSVRSNSPLMLWDRLSLWYGMAKKATKSLKRLNINILDNLDLSSLENDIQLLKEKVKDGALVFAHNDLQYGNIMRLVDSKELIFLDYEYAGTNYMEFDIANYFCEWMADYDSSTPHILDKSKYPSEKEQYEFVHQYFKCLIKHGYHEYTTEMQVLKRISYFTAISHLLWGFWGIFRGESLLCSNFDYISYGIGRLCMYFDLKPTLTETDSLPFPEYQRHF